MFPLSALTREQINQYNQNVWNVSASSSSSSSSGHDDLVQREQEHQQEVRRRRARQRRRNQQVAMVTAATTVANQEAIPRGGSVLGRSYVYRDRMLCKQKIMSDYFNDNPRWSSNYFRRRYRMTVELFKFLMKKVQKHDNYFKDKKDGIGNWGVSGLQKCLSSIRILATGGSFDDSDEYLHIGESTANEALLKFCSAIRAIFTEEFLRRPTEDDVKRILEHNEKRGFPGMLGSIDCMHWVWKNCPTGWAGQYLGSKGKPTIVLEAVATYDLWIWHAFFGVPGSCNDINVLGRSNVFHPLAKGEAAECNYIVNGKPYNVGYYLADGIYPPWATLVSAIKYPKRTKERVFTKRHESVRKDIERAFGVLQARWHIVARPARKHDAIDLGEIMMTCIILHNMIVQNESATIGVENWRPPSSEQTTDLEQAPNGNSQLVQMIKTLTNRAMIEDRITNAFLVADLIQHVYVEDANREESEEDEIVYEYAPSTPEQTSGDDNEDNDATQDGYESD